MKGFSWLILDKNGDVEHLDWEYVELRAALHRKQTGGRSIHILTDEAIEGVIACLALAIREQVLRSRIPDAVSGKDKSPKS